MGVIHGFSGRFHTIAVRIATLVATLGAGILVAAPAQAAPNAVYTLTPDRSSATWSPPRATAQRSVAAGCGKQVSDYCYNVLVHLDAPSIRPEGRMEVFIRAFDPALSNFNLYVYESDAEGTEGRFVGRGNDTGDPTMGGPGEPESVTIPIGRTPAR